MSEYDTLEQHDPMPLLEALKKVREGCEMHMNQLDNDGYCAESDDYVVALAFFEDYIEKIRAEEEKEAMREGEWNRDPCDHIEERERDAMLGEDEQLADEEVFFAFREVLRLARDSIQPWWTTEYKNKTEESIDLIQDYYDNLKKGS
jgi:hypothetical protein